jgi:hypothetical protein
MSETMGLRADLSAGEIAEQVLRNGQAGRGGEQLRGRQRWGGSSGESGGEREREQWREQ